MIDRDVLIVKLVPAFMGKYGRDPYGAPRCQQLIGRSVSEMSPCEMHARALAREVLEFAIAFTSEIKLADDEAQRSSDPIRRRTKRIA